MPYILKTDRPRFEALIQRLLEWIENESLPATDRINSAVHTAELFTCAGDLNYVLSSVLWRYFDKKKSYGRANEITDALNGAYDWLYLKSNDPSISRTEKVVRDVCLQGVTKISTVRGVIRDVESEFRRRRVDAYEDSKIGDSKNGDL